MHVHIITYGTSYNYLGTCKFIAHCWQTGTLTQFHSVFDDFKLRQRFCAEQWWKQKSAIDGGAEMPLGSWWLASFNNEESATW